MVCMWYEGTPEKLLFFIQPYFALIPVITSAVNVFSHKANKKSQSNLEEPCHHPSRQRMVLPAFCSSVQCPLQTNPVTQLPVDHIHASVPHFPSLHYITLSHFFLPHKIYPFPLEDLHPHWKNHPWAHPTYHSKQHNWHTSTEHMYDKLVRDADADVETRI